MITPHRSYLESSRMNFFFKFMSVFMQFIYDIYFIYDKNIEIGNFVHEIINILKRRKKKRSNNYDYMIP